MVKLSLCIILEVHHIYLTYITDVRTNACCKSYWVVLQIKLTIINYLRLHQYKAGSAMYMEIKISDFKPYNRIHIQGICNKRQNKWKFLSSGWLLAAKKFEH